MAQQVKVYATCADLALLPRRSSSGRPFLAHLAMVLAEKATCEEVPLKGEFSVGPSLPYLGKHLLT